MAGSDEYKMTFGRKFYAGIFGICILLTVYTMALYAVPGSVNASVLITLFILITSIVFAYIGGNVWNKWVKSKYFQPGILEGMEK